MRHYFGSAILLSSLLGVSTVACCESLEISPFRTANRSPLVQIFGIPEPENSHITGEGIVAISLAADIANNFAIENTAREHLVLDSELYRTTLSLRYGLGQRLEAGFDLPVVSAAGGNFDGFIEGWHDFFGLPQGSRTEAPHDRILYSYTKNGRELLHLDRSDTGIGDIRLSAGYQLFQPTETNGFAAALRGSVKLPTGRSSMLQGSGSYDVALWLDAADRYTTSIGTCGLFGSLGGIVMSQGDVLPDQQRSFAGFGAVGAGLAPTDWIALTVQFSGNTPLYNDSSLDELATTAVQIHTGGTLRLSESVLMDIAVSEDLAVHTAPDVTLHIALRSTF